MGRMDRKIGTGTRARKTKRKARKQRKAAQVE
jgi:hypothetical protein